MSWPRCLAVISALGVLSFARAAVELSAFASAGGDFRFILANVETGANSGWLSLGDRFEEHRLSRFNVADETLTLEAGGESIHLRMKHEPVEPSGTPRRRVLDDGGAAERRIRQIPIWIDAWGNVALGATAVTFDEIEALFRRLAAANASVELVFVRAPLKPKQNPERLRTTKNAVLGRAQEAGLKKTRSRDVTTDPENR